eukprot:m.150850 g.150850  ORF g.150850 m.150850 type:complete len:624 (-) comp16324_c0_seq3:1153-3024(-)
MDGAYAIFCLLWSFSLASPVLPGRHQLSQYEGLTVLESPVHDEGLTACKLAVVLASRQTLSIVNASAYDWTHQEQVCHFHLVIPIANITLHQTELAIFTNILQVRTRTTLLVFQQFEAFQVQRNAAMIYSHPLADYIVLSDREIRPAPDAIHVLYEAARSPSDPNLPGKPIVVVANVFETFSTSEYLHDTWHLKEKKIHVGQRTFVSVPSHVQKHRLLREVVDSNIEKGRDLIEQHIVEPHMSLINRARICECPGLCPHGMFLLDERLGGAREPHMYSMQVLATCGLHHLYLETKSAGMFLRPGLESPLEDCMADLLFRSFERNLAGQMWLESLFDFDSVPCFGRYIVRLELLGRHRRWTSLTGAKPRFDANTQHIHDTPLVLRRQFQLLLLDLFGFTSYHIYVNGDQTNKPFAQRVDVEEAFRQLETVSRTPGVTQVELEAMVDLTREPPYSLPDAEKYSTDWMQLLAEPRDNTLNTFSLPTTMSACLQHMHPLFWIRIVGGESLLTDPVVTKLTSTHFTRVDGQVEVWTMLEYKSSWYVSRRYIPDSDPIMVEGWVTAYLKRMQLAYSSVEVLWPWQMSFNSTSVPSSRQSVRVDMTSGVDGYSLAPKMLRMVKVWLKNTN